MTPDEFRERLITGENRRHAEIMAANWNRGEDVMSVINELRSDMLSATDDDYILPHHSGCPNRIWFCYIFPDSFRTGRKNQDMSPHTIPFQMKDMSDFRPVHFVHKIFNI